VSIGRPPGLPKTGGRKKGTPNRATLTLREILLASGCDPGAGIAKIAEDPENPVTVRLQAYALLMPYYHPKLKPIDDASLQGAVGPHAITKEEALELAHELIALLGPGGAPPQKPPTSVSRGQLEPPLAEPSDEN
jgi:hypothetical protein